MLNKILSARIQNRPQAERQNTSRLRYGSLESRFALATVSPALTDLCSNPAESRLEQTLQQTSTGDDQADHSLSKDQLKVPCRENAAPRLCSVAFNGGQPFEIPLGGHEGLDSCHFSKVVPTDNPSEKGGQTVNPNETNLVWFYDSPIGNQAPTISRSNHLVLNETRSEGHVNENQAYKASSTAAHPINPHSQPNAGCSASADCSKLSPRVFNKSTMGLFRTVSLLAPVADQLVPTLSEMQKDRVGRDGYFSEFDRQLASTSAKYFDSGLTEVGQIESRRPPTLLVSIESPRPGTICLTSPSKSMSVAKVSETAALDLSGEVGSTVFRPSAIDVSVSRQICDSGAANSQRAQAAVESLRHHSDSDSLSVDLVEEEGAVNKSMVAASIGGPEKQSPRKKILQFASSALSVLYFAGIVSSAGKRSNLIPLDNQRRKKRRFLREKSK